MTDPVKAETLSYEQARDELVLIVQRLESGGAPLEESLALWERDFRPNVEQNQRLATDGLATLLPDSRFGIFARNQSMRALPMLSRLGRGFGGRLERASRAVELPREP